MKATKPHRLAASINERLQLAAEYINTVGWSRASTGGRGEPVDLYGALIHCAKRDGTEVVARRMLASVGYDEAWNDLRCSNIFEARQVLASITVTHEMLDQVYGRNYYALIGTLKLLTACSHEQLHALSGHIGPGDEASILSLMERLPVSPAFEDAHLVHFDGKYGQFDRRIWLLTDALVAHCLAFPLVDDRVADVLAPVAVKLGL